MTIKLNFGRFLLHIFKFYHGVPRFLFYDIFNAFLDLLEFKPLLQPFYLDILSDVNLSFLVEKFRD